MIEVGSVWFSGTDKDDKVLIIEANNTSVVYEWGDMLRSQRGIKSFLDNFTKCTHDICSRDKYNHEVIGKDGTRTVIDVYRVLEAFGVTNPMLQHAAKKCLQAGQRGHKDLLTDLHDIKSTIEQAIKMEEQR